MGFSLGKLAGGLTSPFGGGLLGLGGDGGDGSAPAMSAEGELAQRKWADYKKRFIPVENKFLALARKTPGQFDRARGMATADVARATDPKAAVAFRSRLLAGGGSPGSGASVMDMAGMTVDRAATAGRATNSATLATRGQHLSGLKKAVALGRNIADSSDLAGRRVAEMTSREALAAADADAMERAGLYNAIGAGAGAYAQHKFKFGIPETPRMDAYGMPVNGYGANGQPIQ